MVMKENVVTLMSGAISRACAMMLGQNVKSAAARKVIEIGGLPGVAPPDRRIGVDEQQRKAADA